MSLVSIAVFVVDDHEAIRRGLRNLLAEVADIELVGEADSAATALEGIERTAPDVAILDVRLPDIDGVDLCRDIRSRFPDVHCLMYTAYSSDEGLLKSIMAGAGGYILKGAPGEELLEAVRMVNAGHSLIDPAAIELLAQMMRRAPLQQTMMLSPQQERVFELIVEGLSNREIGDRLSLTEKTVKNYVSAILDKLQVRSRTQAAVLGAKLRKGEASSGE